MTTNIKPDGPRSDSRRHRVGLSVGSIGFRPPRCRSERPPMCFADLWSRADAAGKLLPAWARLGPLSMNRSLRIVSHRRLPATFVVAAAHPRVGWRSGFPTGRPWDFALATAGLPDAPCTARLTHHAISRTLLPRITGPSPRLRAALARWVRRTADRGTLSPRGGESASCF